jgi:hypothetical protein
MLQAISSPIFNIRPFQSHISCSSSSAALKLYSLRVTINHLLDNKTYFWIKEANPQGCFFLSTTPMPGLIICGRQSRILGNVACVGQVKRALALIISLVQLQKRMKMIFCKKKSSVLCPAIHALDSWLHPSRFKGTGKPPNSKATSAGKFGM